MLAESMRPHPRFRGEHAPARPRWAAARDEVRDEAWRRPVSFADASAESDKAADAGATVDGVAAPSATVLL